jgi:hypothetical protein
LVREWLRKGSCVRIGNFFGTRDLPKKRRLFESTPFFYGEKFILKELQMAKIVNRNM